MRLSLKEGNFVIYDGSIAGRMAVRDLLYMNRIEISFEEITTYRTEPPFVGSLGDFPSMSYYDTSFNLHSRVSQGLRIHYRMPNGCDGTKILCAGEAILFTGDDLALVKNYTLDREKSLLLINE